MSDQEDVPFITAHPAHMKDFDLTTTTGIDYLYYYFIIFAFNIFQISS